MVGRAELVCCRATERPKFGLVQLNFEGFLMVSIHRLALLWKANGVLHRMLLPFPNNTLQSFMVASCAAKVPGKFIWTERKKGPSYCATLSPLLCYFPAILMSRFPCF